jgi:DNA-directed RNA polymerase alpha subunit
MSKVMHLIKTIKISEPAQRALKSIGIETLEQLAQYTEKELLALHGFGPKALGILKKSLEEIGLMFKTDGNN